MCQGTGVAVSKAHVLWSDHNFQESVLFRSLEIELGPSGLHINHLYRWSHVTNKYSWIYRITCRASGSTEETKSFYDPWCRACSTVELPGMNGSPVAQ